MVMMMRYPLNLPAVKKKYLPNAAQEGKSQWD